MTLMTSLFTAFIEFHLINIQLGNDFDVRFFVCLFRCPSPDLNRSTTERVNKIKDKTLMWLIKLMNEVCSDQKNVEWQSFIKWFIALYVSCQLLNVKNGTLYYARMVHNMNRLEHQKRIWERKLKKKTQRRIDKDLFKYARLHVASVASLP